MDDQNLPLEKCCQLGKSWAEEGLKCENFIGPVPGIAEDEQEFCLQGVSICCIRTYREKSCLQGKEDARSGKGCNQGSSNQKKIPIGIGNYRRDCCEGCRLGKFYAFQQFLFQSNQLMNSIWILQNKKIKLSYFCIQKFMRL